MQDCGQLNSLLTAPDYKTRIFTRGGLRFAARTNLEPGISGEARLCFVLVPKKRDDAAGERFYMDPDPPLCNQHSYPPVPPSYEECTATLAADDLYCVSAGHGSFV